jgi:hypothetical protein
MPRSPATGKIGGKGGGIAGTHGEPGAGTRRHRPGTLDFPTAAPGRIDTRPRLSLTCIDP